MKEPTPAVDLHQGLDDTTATGDWTLYWPDSNSKFHRYEDLAPTNDVERLLVEIDADPACIFWG